MEGKELVKAADDSAGEGKGWGKRGDDRGSGVGRGKKVSRVDEKKEVEGRGEKGRGRESESPPAGSQISRCSRTT